MREPRYIPRWLHYRVNVSAGNDGWGFTELPPNAFTNETIWPFHLETLTFNGPLLYKTDEDGAHYVWAYWGGISTIQQLELGISGSSDVNQVIAPTAAIACNKERFVVGPHVMNTYTDGSVFHKFKHPYLLARGNGLNVKFRNATPQTTEYDGIYRGYPAMMAHGVSTVTKQPKIIAGTYRVSDEPHLDGIYSDVQLGPGQDLTFIAADLVNDGEEDVLINELVLTFPWRNCGSWVMADIAQSQSHRFGAMTGIGPEYSINPINGPQWMPGSDTLPVMSICPLTLPHPFARWGVGAELSVARVYTNYTSVLEFEPNTVLRRRQRLSVKFYDDVDLSHTMDVTLFGYLEVL